MAQNWNDTVDGKIDPIMELMERFKADDREGKVNLGVGVYQDANGHVPVFKAVKSAEAYLCGHQRTKNYVGVAGDEAFVEALVHHILEPGEDDRHWIGLQSIGGSGALRLIADFCSHVAPGSRVWMPKPTWPNHIPLFTSAGLRLEQYAYPSYEYGDLLEGILDSLEGANPGDFIVVHACCHNPTGIDPNNRDFERLLSYIKDRRLIPIFDAAYIGFKNGFTNDCRDLGRALAEFDVAMCAFSASKNLSLYRERTGVVLMTGRDPGELGRWRAIFLKLARATYSMPPDHGAAVVRTILQDHDLRNTWLDELEEVRYRLITLRRMLAEGLQERGFPHKVDHVQNGSGLFSLLPFTGDQIEKLQKRFGIFVIGGGRVNVAGLNERNIDHVVNAFVQVTK